MVGLYEATLARKDLKDKAFTLAVGVLVLRVTHLEQTAAYSNRTPCCTLVNCLLRSKGAAKQEGETREALMQKATANLHGLGIIRPP